MSINSSDRSLRLSLKLEPPENDSKSVFYVRENSQTHRSLNGTSMNTLETQHSLTSSTSSNRLSVSFNCSDSTNANSMPAYNKKRFTAGHRKANSLGTNVLSSITAIPLSSKSLSSKQNFVRNNKNRCLIDDSLLSDETTIKTVEPFEKTLLPKFDIIKDRIAANKLNEELPLNRYIDHSLSISEDKVLYQGLVKRKTVLKDGKKPSVSFATFCPLVRNLSFGFGFVISNIIRLFIN